MKPDLFDTDPSAVCGCGSDTTDLDHTVAACIYGHNGHPMDCGCDDCYTADEQVFPGITGTTDLF